MATRETGFGDLLRRYRIAAGLTQEELAERAGVSTRGISDLERGARGLPRKDTLQLLLHGLDLAQQDRAALTAAARRSPALASNKARSDGQVPLPISPTPLVGRQRELAILHELLLQPDVRLLTLTGPGGTGKTRLGLQLASDLYNQFADGVTFVPLAPITDPELVASTIAQALGIREMAGRPLLSSLQGQLSDKEHLLLLDNFEQVVAAAPLVAELLSACPGLKVLVTSRALLHVRGEREFTIPPLVLPDSQQLPHLEALAQNDAVCLFVARAQDVAADFSLTHENAPAIVETVRRLDGLPLALELAAARMRVLSPAALLTRLDRRLPLLTGGARDLPDRQKSLRATISWSYDLLPSNQRALLRRMAVFAGGAPLAAVEAVCAWEDEVFPLDELTGLIDHSLVRQRDGPHSEPRYTMLETIREYAWEQLVANGELKAVQQRHTGFFLELAEEAKSRLGSAEELTWFERLEAEHDNLRAALQSAIDRSDITSAQRLCAGVWQFWFHRGHYAEATSWLDRALDLGASPVSLRVELLLAAGQFARHHGEYERAVVLGEEVLARSRTDRFALGIGFGEFLLGNIAGNLGDWETGRRRMSEALTIFRTEGDTWWSGRALGYLASLALQGGDVRLYEALSAEKLHLSRSTGDAWGASDALANLAEAALLRGDDERALALRKESFAARRQQSNRLGLLDELRGIAEIAVRQGHLDDAARWLGAEEAVRQEAGFVLAPVIQASYECHVAALRDTLGEETFTAAWSEGRRLSLDQATNEIASFVGEMATSASEMSPLISSSHESTGSR